MSNVNITGGHGLERPVVLQSISVTGEGWRAKNTASKANSHLWIYAVFLLRFINGFEFWCCILQEKRILQQWTRFTQTLTWKSELEPSENFTVV